MPKAKDFEATADPDKLVRQAAGTYRTADNRFEVRGGASNGWFLVDAEQANDFGQALIQGPFATLNAVRGAIPSARSAKITPIRPLAAPKKRSAKARERKPPPPPPPTWIELLPSDEAAAVRRLIRALEGEGITDAEALVRQDRDGIGPAIATRVIERRLAAIVEELPEAARSVARDLVRRTTEVLTAEGTAMPRGVPGWSLVEIGPEPEPENRRITIRELPEGT